MFCTSCCIFFRCYAKQYFPFPPCHLHTWNKSASWLKKTLEWGKVTDTIPVWWFSWSLWQLLLSLAELKAVTLYFSFGLRLQLSFLKNQRSASACCCWCCILCIAQTLTFYCWGGGWDTNSKSSRILQVRCLRMWELTHWPIKII